MKRSQVREGPDLSLRVEKALRGFGVAEGDRLVVGVSGGPDSVCLLALLKDIRQRYRIELHVAHLDHGLRGAESEADARFVEDLARQWEISATVEAVSISALAKKARMSLQVAAREARTHFFERVAEKTQGRWIVLGHTADDQAETLLLRLFRGSGSKGLSSIPPIRRASADRKEGIHIIRPILGLRRAEILNYLKKRCIPFRQDSSNENLKYQRNRLRSKVIPLLESNFNPGLVEALCRTSELLKDEDEFLTARAAEVLKGLRTDGPGPGLTLSRPGFLGLHNALQRAVLREALLRARGDLAGIAYRHLDDALHLIRNGDPGKSLRLPRETCVTLLYERFWIHPDHLVSGPCEEVVLSVPGRAYCSALGRWVKVSLQDRTPSRDPKSCAVYDYERIHPPFLIRGRRNGDYFSPDGMGGRTKKLQDFFVDQKIPRYERGRVPLFTASEGILWVMGWRLDGRFLADSRSKSVMVVEIEPRGD